MDYRQDNNSKYCFDVRNLTPLPPSLITLDICKKGVLGRTNTRIGGESDFSAKSTVNLLIKCFGTFRVRDPHPFGIYPNANHYHNTTCLAVRGGGQLARIVQRGFPLYRPTIFSFSERSWGGVLFVLRYCIRKNKIRSHQLLLILITTNADVCSKQSTVGEPSLNVYIFKMW